MEGSHYQYWMYVRREQMMKSHSHLLHKAPIMGDDRKNNWEERAFAEDAARILGGSMWPPRSYSCTFCKREFRSAQALGGHMNIHRRDRARLKQNPSPHHNYEPFHHHHENDDRIKSLSGNNHHFSAPGISTQINCGLTHAHNYSSQATTISTTRSLSCISKQENCGQQHKFSPSSSSILGHMGSLDSEQEGVVKGKEYNFKGLGCSNYVETSLSVGLTSMFGQNSSATVPCGDRSNISCKRLKTGISSLPLLLRPCSKDKGLAFQPVEISLGLDHGMEDVDLELRLGKQHKVK